MFRRVAIVNRGEAAMRLIHAVRDLSGQTGARIETVAFHTDADRAAMFVREADLAYPLGPAAARPYLDHAVLERALTESGADAAWVGWGFVAEDPAFSELCERIGVTFIGPDAEAMRRLGDKIGAKLIAEEAGVPVAPWSRGPVATLEDALAHAERIGYPVMLKATAGGGGRGIRVITSAADLTEAFERTSDEALRAFGSGTLFLERLVTGARHVEVQVIADGQGTAWALGVRDCSVQRRNQKVIEESASPVLDAEQVENLKSSSERLVLSVGYRGAATVEFLYHPGEKAFAFLEVNTRLQVEHPVTELTTGTDLVGLQLHVASGGRLEGGKPAESGHAIEARLNAEDPDRDFAPAPGRVAALALPAGPGIRVDTGVGEGDTIPADFDSMIAKIIAYGRDRGEALGRLRRAMAETTAVIEGGATNKSFVLDLLGQPEVTGASAGPGGSDADSAGAGWADTGWIDRVRGEGRLSARRHSAVALAAAAIEAYSGEEEVSTRRLLATAHGGRPQVRHDADRPLDFKLRGDSYRVRVARLGLGRYRVGISTGAGAPGPGASGPGLFGSGPADLGPADVEIERFDAHSGRITVNGGRFRLTTAAHGPVCLAEVDGVAHRVSRDEGGIIRSPAPALVVATPLAPGDEVAADAPVLVLESMKMETVLRAPFRARLRECLVSVGSQVAAGAPLLRLEPLVLDEGGAGVGATDNSSNRVVGGAGGGVAVGAGSGGVRVGDADNSKTGVAGENTANQGNGAGNSNTDNSNSRAGADTADNSKNDYSNSGAGAGGSADNSNTRAGAGGDAAELPDYLALPTLPAMAADQVARRHLADLRGLILGFDGDADDRQQLVGDYLAVRAELGGQPLDGELELLTVFADLSELSRNRPGNDLKEEPGSAVHSPREYFHSYLRSLDIERARVPESFQARLEKVLGHYGVAGLDQTPELETSVFRIFLAQQRMADGATIVSAVLRQWLAGPPPAEPLRERAGLALEHLIEATQRRFPAVSDLARGVVFRWFAQPLLRRSRARAYATVRGDLRYLDRNPDAPDRQARIQAMVAVPEPLFRLIGQRIERGGRDHAPLLEVLTRRYYGNRRLGDFTAREIPGGSLVTTADAAKSIAAAATESACLPDAIDALGDVAAGLAADRHLVADVYVNWDGKPDPDGFAARTAELLAARRLPPRVERITVTAASTAMRHHVTFRPIAVGLEDGPEASQETGFAEDRLIRGLHPETARRLRLGRLREFDLTRLPSADEEIYLFKAVAKTNRRDERLIAMGQVRDLTPLREADGRLVALPALEDLLAGCLDAIRVTQAQRPQHKRFEMNRVLLYVWPTAELTVEEMESLMHRIRPTVSGAGIEEVEFVARMLRPGGDGAVLPRPTGPGRPPGEVTEVSVVVRTEASGRTRLHIAPLTDEPVTPLDDYRQQVLRAARRGNAYPYELASLLTGPDGTFTEHDLDDSGTLVPVDRPKGRNTAGIVTGIVTTPTPLHPEGVTRVVLLGDPTKALGSLSEPECARVIAALDLAARTRVPVEWFALSAGAKISMTSGTENLDWVAAALKRIVEFTQDGGEINVVVAGITVGGQPYWNAEATMLMHTKGILVMTPDSAMVLTGKQSLDFSGGVSAEDNFGIGGYDRVMGPNGEAQYWAPNLRAAARVLMEHYDHTYVVPGETGPRRAVTTDPFGRNVSEFAHNLPGSDFRTVGEIFSSDRNPDRKKPFDIRTVMRALSDQDFPVLERWAGMADAETSVVQDVRIGGWPACLIGIESRALLRRGFPPADGPDTYTAGTLFPKSSKKTARAINAASGNRPVVVLANLSGFDGSPESLRELQLEYGAEIGRAIVNFDGPIVFCVISRYHGGAFVVFSKALNPNMTVLALEGSFASVLGGAPAAAVVFSGEVSKRTADDPRVADMREHAAETSGAERAALSARLAEVTATVRAEKLAEVAAEFDAIHSIQRAVEVGSVDKIISVAELRPAIIDAIGQGLSRSY